MKKMTHELRAKIRKYIKNGIDISDLIRDVEIKGENLSRAIIKDFNRVADDISGTDFSYAVIGEEGKITNISGTKMRNCNFRGTKFLGKVWMRRVDARGSNFSEAYLPNVEYQHSDFRNCTFCSTVIRMGSREGLGAIFGKELWDLLTKGWIFK